MSAITAQEVSERCAAIAAAGNADPEASHWDEDTLRIVVLRAIADGEVSWATARYMAQQLIALDEAGLERWFA